VKDSETGTISLQVVVKKLSMIVLLTVIKVLDVLILFLSTQTTKLNTSSAFATLTVPTPSPYAHNVACPWTTPPARTLLLAPPPSPTLLTFVLLPQRKLRPPILTMEKDSRGIHIKENYLERKKTWFRTVL